MIEMSSLKVYQEQCSVVILKFKYDFYYQQICPRVTGGIANSADANPNQTVHFTFIL